MSLPIGQSLNVWRGGDITYGGLVTIKSNFSPATGAKISLSEIQLDGVDLGSQPSKLDRAG